MKTLKITILIAFLLTGISTPAQELGPIDTNPEKATVYIVRISSLGYAINFKYFIGNQYIGKCKHKNYIKIEVDPGEHLFWSKAENRSFIVAKLEAGKTYMINAIPRMGGLKAAVHLSPIDTKDEKEMKKLKKYFTKKTQIIFDETEVAQEGKELVDLIQGSLKDYENKWKGSSNVELLSESININEILSDVNN